LPHPPRWILGVVFAYAAPRQSGFRICGAMSAKPTCQKGKTHWAKENDRLPHEEAERTRGGPAGSAGGTCRWAGRGEKREGEEEDRLPSSPRVQTARGGTSSTAVAVLVAVRWSTGEGWRDEARCCGRRRADWLCLGERHIVEQRQAAAALSRRQQAARGGWHQRRRRGRASLGTPRQAREVVVALVGAQDAAVGRWAAAATFAGTAVAAAKASAPGVRHRVAATANSCRPRRGPRTSSSGRTPCGRLTWCYHR
jgi:hypothetical protein